jgi:uncharacterized protein YbcV (DUF1398 family)
MQEVIHLLERALDGGIYFEEFGENAHQLGVASIAFDVPKRRHTFYTKDHREFDHVDDPNSPLEVSETFDQNQIETAILAFDKREYTARKFHKALARAGVSHVRCYLNNGRAIYLSPKGDFYVEQW